MKKPKIWSRKVKGKRKLTTKAKEYLSFKLKAYYRTKEEKAIRKRPTIKEDTPIRIWVKFSYIGAKPLFIEAFIDGYYRDRDKMKRILIRSIEQNFGMKSAKVAEEAELGYERIEKLSRKSSDMAIRYKHNLSAPWRYLR